MIGGFDSLCPLHHPRRCASGVFLCGPRPHFFLPQSGPERSAAKPHLISLPCVKGGARTAGGGIVSLAPLAWWEQFRAQRGVPATGGDEECGHGPQTREPAFQAGDGRPHHNRGISAEMQCGTASRAARDLPARPVPRKTAGAPGMERPEFIPSGSPPHHARRGMEPCSPVNPFFLDGRFGLGEGASHALGGVSGRILASGRIARFLAPTIFLGYRQAAPSRAAKPPRCFCAAPTSVGVRRREPVCRATGVY